MAVTATILNIQRFSLHDGPGIRTTVFFKGCPLSCGWCSNPESQKPTPQLAFVQKNCRHCLACVEVCRTGAQYHVNGVHGLNFDACTHCGDCVEVCPHGALKMYGDTMTVDEIMQVIEKDRAYYDASGGGVTISGGEPFLQYDVLLALLQRCKDAGIHTCIETTGFTLTEKMSAAALLVDYFLFDFKLYDAADHQRLTGVSNQLILHNLQLLHKLGKTVHLRCPIIPGVNDTDAHFRAIAEISRTYKAIESVELLPFHDYGRSKAAEIGAAFSIAQAAATNEQAAAWEQAVAGQGCDKLITADWAARRNTLAQESE